MNKKRSMINSMVTGLAGGGLLSQLASAEFDPESKNKGRQTLGGLRPTKKTFFKSKQRAKVKFARKCNKLRRMK